MTIDNLYVTYDDDGNPCYFVNDEEVTESVWAQRHPNFKGGNDNGGNQDGRGFGRSGEAGGGVDAKERQRQALRAYRQQRKSEDAAAAEAQ